MHVAQSRNFAFVQIYLKQNGHSEGTVSSEQVADGQKGNESPAHAASCSSSVISPGVFANVSFRLLRVSDAAMLTSWRD